MVTMPKAAVDEDCFPARPKHYVRRAGQILGMEPISIAKPVQQAPHYHFRCGVLASNSLHDCAALGDRESVHRTLNQLLVVQSFARIFEMKEVASIRYFGIFRVILYKVERFQLTD